MGSFVKLFPDLPCVMKRMAKVFFCDKANAENVLKAQWLWYSSILILQPWMSLLDPNDDILEVNLVWIKLPRLPLDFL